MQVEDAVLEAVGAGEQLVRRLLRPLDRQIDLAEHRGPAGFPRAAYGLLEQCRADSSTPVCRQHAWVHIHEVSVVEQRIVQLVDAHQLVALERGQRDLAHRVVGRAEGDRRRTQRPVRRQSLAAVFGDRLGDLPPSLDRGIVLNVDLPHLHGRRA
jgi:hypothetical protein